MFKGTSSSFLRLLQPSAQRAGLPSGHGAVRLGQMFSFIAWKTGSLEAVADSSLRTPTLVAQPLARSHGDLLGCALGWGRLAALRAVAVRLRLFILERKQSGRLHSLGSTVPRDLRQSRAGVSVCPAGTSTGPTEGVGWRACQWSPAGLEHWIVQD